MAAGLSVGFCSSSPKKITWTDLTGSHSHDFTAKCCTILSLNPEQPAEVRWGGSTMFRRATWLSGQGTGLGSEKWMIDIQVRAVTLSSHLFSLSMVESVSSPSIDKEVDVLWITGVILRQQSDVVVAKCSWKSFSYTTNLTLRDPAGRPSSARRKKKHIDKQTERKISPEVHMPSKGKTGKHACAPSHVIKQ